MDASEYRAAIAEIGFSSILDAGRWLGVADSTAKKYATDGPSPPVAKFLKYMLAEEMTPADVDRVIRRAKPL